MAIVDMGGGGEPAEGVGAHRFLGGLPAFSQSRIASARGSCYDKTDKRKPNERQREGRLCPTPDKEGGRVWNTRP